VRGTARGELNLSTTAGTFDFTRPDIVGKQIVLNRRLVTVTWRTAAVAGLTTQSLNLWLLVLDTYTARKCQSGKNESSNHPRRRLKPRVTLGAARSEAKVIAGGLRNPGAPGDRGASWW